MTASVVTRRLERTEGVADEHRLVAVAAAKALGDEHLVAEWRQLLGKDGNRCKLFISPEWIANITHRNNAPILIWFARNVRGELIGVVPVAQREFRLTYDVANRVLCKKSLRMAEVLGSQPCLPDDDLLLKSLFKGILDTWPDCDGILFDALPADCFCSRVVRTWEKAGAGIVYSPFDQRPSIVTTICASFDEYMSSKNAKTRSTLRRKLRMFTDSGATQLRRYSDASEVSEFVEGLSRVNFRTWQNRLLGIQYRNDGETCATFRDLADRRLLRSYLLWRDGQPFAYVVGYQYDGVFHYADVGFDPQVAELSPGTVLLFLILQDLHEYDPPKELNFGVGDAAYKQRFGTIVGSDETLLLLRRGMRNRGLVLTHAGFMAGLSGIKRAIGRKVRK